METYLYIDTWIETYNKKGHLEENWRAKLKLKMTVNRNTLNFYYLKIDQTWKILKQTKKGNMNHKRCRIIDYKHKKIHIWRWNDLHKLTPPVKPIICSRNKVFTFQKLSIECSKEIKNKCWWNFSKLGRVFQFFNCNSNLIIFMLDFQLENEISLL